MSVVEARVQDAPTPERPPAAAPPGGPHRRLRRPRRETLVRAALAVVAGLAMFAAFPPIGVWPLAPVGVALATGVCRGVPLWRSYRLGVLTGVGLLLPMVRFVSYVGLDAWFVLAVAEAAILALVAPVTTLVSRLRGWPVWVACGWVAQEALRDREPFGGFPWGKLAFSQPGSPFTPLVALGGTPLVSFAVALSGALLLAAALTARGAGLARIGRPAALVAGALGVAVIGLAVPLPTAAQAGSVTVAAIQGDVQAAGGLAALGQERQVTANHLAGTLKLAATVDAGQAARPDLVLWPENSADLDPFHDPATAAMLSEASRAIGRPILVGAVLDGPGTGHVRNAGLVWGPGGWLGQMYVKQHPVPFAEYLPGRAVLAKMIKRFATEMPNDFVKGKAPGNLTINRVRIGDVICFEVAYDGLVRETVDHGATMLVVQTNNASFGRKGESQQQLAMSRLRAVEFGRSTVQVSTSGQSAIIMPDGHVVTQSGLYTPAQLTARVPLRTSRTLADRVGVWPEVGFVLLALGALALGLGSFTSSGRRGEKRCGGPVMSARDTAGSGGPDGDAGSDG